MNKKITSLNYSHNKVIILLLFYTGYCFGEKQLSLEAEKLIYHMTSGQMHAESVYINFEPIYCKASKTIILEDKLLNIYNGKLTTCNIKDNPHYYFATKELRLSPQKLIAKHLLIKIFNIPIFYLPVYVHYLHDTRPKFLLTSGYKEGNIYFAVKYNYLINSLSGSLFIDFIPKDKNIGLGISCNRKDAEANAYLLKKRYSLSFKYNKKILPILTNISLNFLSDSDVEKDYKQSLYKQKELKSLASLTLDKNEHLIFLLGMQSYEIYENKFIKKEELLPEISYHLKPKKIPALPIYYTINTNFLNKYNNISSKREQYSDFKINFFNCTYFKNFLIKPQAKINYSFLKKHIDTIYSLLLTYIHNNLKFDLDYKDYNLTLSLMKNFKNSGIYIMGDYPIKDSIFKASLINFYTKNLQISINETSANNYSLSLSKKIQDNLTTTLAYINNNNINLILNGKLHKTKFNIFYDLNKNTINFMDFSYNIDLHCIEAVVLLQKSFADYNYYLTFNLKRL